MPLPDLRDAIQDQIRQLFAGGDTGPSRIDDPTGDAGLFGPDSACWKVHGDFTSMMVGGVAALLLQMLHPGALAGVWDHSNFRQDRLGRLRRTAQFIAGTTYGPTDHAEALIDRVRTIHEKVVGTLPDGQPYQASDPALLTWVHVAEVSMFLAAYLKHRDPSFPPAEQDRYLAETAEVARRLGAREIPVTRAEVEAYFLSVRPQLRYDERTREVAETLLARPPGSPAVAAFSGLVFRAAEDLLPDWAAGLHGFQAGSARIGAVRLGVDGVGSMMRWALNNGAEVRARRRVANLAGRGG